MEKLSDLFTKSDLCIIYHPIHGEIDPKSLPFKLPKRHIYTPVSPHINPEILGKEVGEQFGKIKGIILVPGNKFDKFGGRHGKGFGWYDRFLSKTPRSWIRIGICSQKGYSDSRLVLHKWDEVMDWLIVKSHSGYNFYETGARDI